MLKNWHRKFTSKTLKLTEEDLETSCRVCEDLFKKEEFTNELPFEFDYNSPAVDDSIPQEENIKLALSRMRRGKAPGLIEISVDDLKDWCEAAHKEDPSEEELDLWSKIVELT